MNVFRELLNFLVPAKCQLCQKPGWSICQTCRAGLPFDPVVTTRGFTETGPAFRGIRLFEYQEPLQQLIHAFKERGITELVPLIFGAVQLQSITELAESAFGQPTATEILLVPVPSSTASYRSRGFSPATVVATGYRRLLAQLGWRVRVVRLLRRSRLVRDQSLLTTQERWQNQTQSMVARHQVSGSVILIDDISTTGATLLEARRAVEASGGKVIGFCTLAETLLKRSAIYSKPDT